MRLLQYTIIIWMSCAHAGERFEPIFDPPIELAKTPIRHESPREPVKPIRPIEPRHDQILHTDPTLPKPTLPHGDTIRVAELPVHLDPLGIHTAPVELSVPSSVQTYVNQHALAPELIGVEVLSGAPTVDRIRIQYLERMQKVFDPERLITMPQVVVGSTSFIQKGVGPSLVEWMVSLTDGLSFAEHLSQLPTASEAQKQQFLFSPEKKVAYEVAKTALVQSGKNLLEMVASLHAQYADSIGMEGRSMKNFTEDEMKALSAQGDSVKALLETTMAQRRTLVTLLCENSPSYDEALLSATIDAAPGVEAWKTQERISEQSATIVFSSYESFMSGFVRATTIKEYVQNFIGPEKGKFASVQALITALDKVGFILESKNFWLSFRNHTYSKKMVDTILTALVKEYPETFIPSKKFILQYCKLHRSFKPLSFFIPRYDQFLIDAKTLTIDELAKKYGQEPAFLQSLLNSTYEAVYVLQQTNQAKQARDLTTIVQRILLEHPEMTPAVVAQVIADENLPIQMVYSGQGEFAHVALELKNEIVTLQATQFQKSLTGVSSQLARAQAFIKESFLSAEPFLTEKAAEGIVALASSSRLGKVLTGVLEQLQKAEDSFEFLSRVKENSSINSSDADAHYQDTLEQLQSVKQDAMSFAVQVEYEKARGQQDTFSAQLLASLQDTLKEEFLSYTQSYISEALFGITSPLKTEPLSNDSVMEVDSGSTTDALINQIVENSVLEKQSEKDYQACIWASNKMGMMESKILCISALLKIEKTPAFLVNYKNALKDIEADFLFLSTAKTVQKCLNVIAKRSFLLEKIKDLEKDLKALQQEIEDEQKLKSAS
jgi:hypothetical protein